MKLADADAALKELRRRPLRTIGVLLLIVVAIIGMHFLVTYSGEKARQAAGPNGDPRLEDVLRVSYYRIESAEMLSRFLQGQTYTNDAGFESSSYVVNNAVYRALKTLLNLLPEADPSRLYTEIELHAVANDGQPIDSLSLSAYRDAMDPKPGEPGHHRSFIEEVEAIRPATTTGPHDPHQLLRRVETDPLWTIDKVDISRTIPGAQRPEFMNFFFVGFPTSEELMRATSDPITQKIAEANPHKRDLAIAKAYFIHSAYFGHIAARELSVLALDIENISEEPVQLDSLTLRAFEPDDLFLLSTAADLRESLGRSPPQTYKPPVDKLLPGEHVLVPLRISLGVSRAPSRFPGAYEETVIDESTFPDDSEWWEGAAGSSVSIPIVLGWTDDHELDVVSREVSLTTLRSRESLRELFTDLYHLGPAIDVTDMVGRRTGRPGGELRIRDYDPTNVVFRGGDEVGSCPILYANVSGSWHRLGPVFPFAVGRNFAGSSVTELPAGTTGVRLLEEEKERSYVDGLRLQYATSSAEEGTGEELLPFDDLYVALDPGDEISFDLAAPTGKNVQLLVRGYYTPLFGP